MYNYIVWTYWVKFSQNNLLMKIITNLMGRKKMRKKKVGQLKMWQMMIPQARDNVKSTISITSLNRRIKFGAVPQKTQDSQKISCISQEFIARIIIINYVHAPFIKPPTHPPLERETWNFMVKRWWSANFWIGFTVNIVLCQQTAL